MEKTTEKAQEVGDSKQVVKCLKCGRPFPATLQGCPYCKAPVFRFDNNHKSVKCKKCTADLPVTTVKCPYCGRLQLQGVSVIFFFSTMLLLGLAFCTMVSIKSPSNTALSCDDIKTATSLCGTFRDSGKSKSQAIDELSKIYSRGQYSQILSAMADDVFENPAARNLSPDALGAAAYQVCMSKR